MSVDGASGPLVDERLVKHPGDGRLVASSVEIAPTSDYAEIAALHTRSWQNTYRGIFTDAWLDSEARAEHLRYWQQRFQSLEETGDFIRAARVNGELAGFVYAGFHPTPDGIMIYNLHVEGQYHGRGIGRMLLSEVARWAEPRGEPLCLEVFAANERAVRFYRRNGGEPIGQFVEELGDGSRALTLKLQFRDVRALTRESCSFTGSG